jgi:hypothetical protein
LPRRAERAWRGRAAIALAALAAFAAPDACAGTRAIRLGPACGALVLDGRLSGYGWDTAPRGVWGVQGAVTGDRFGWGVRFWRTATSQSTGFPGEVPSPEVRLTGTEACGEFRFASFARIRWHATASFGLLHVGYSPDRIEVDAGGAPIEVELAPLDEAIGGVGLALRRALPGGVDLSLGVERSWFSLDTSHRAGSEIVERRERFGNWAARLELSRRILAL